MLVQEIVRSLTIDCVWADEPFNLAAIHQLEPGLVEILHLGELEADLLIEADPVKMTALHHERTRTDQGGHLRVVERAAEVELKDLVLAGPDVGVRGLRR